MNVTDFPQNNKINIFIFEVKTKGKGRKFVVLKLKNEAFSMLFSGTEEKQLISFFYEAITAKAI